MDPYGQGPAGALCDEKEWAVTPARQTFSFLAPHPFLPPTLSLFTRPRELRGKIPGAASPAAFSGDGLFQGMSGFNGPSRHVDETVVAAACHRTYVR